MLETSNNRLGGSLDEAELAAIKKADAVIVPQGCKKELYEAASRGCPHVFPNYDAFFQYPGKIGQIRLFQKFKVPHPLTQVFDDLSAWKKEGKNPAFPFVFKFSWGGEGRNVFLVGSETELAEYLELAAGNEKEGKRGFVFQEYIPVNGRSLRVVVMAEKFISYWRCHEEENNFYSNLARGAVIDRDADPEMQQAALGELKKFCTQTKINLAGFDFIFDPRQAKPTPLFLEINYFFRCHGLGGPDGYLELLTAAVREWIDSLSRP